MIHLIPLDEAHLQSQVCWCNPQLVPGQNLEGNLREKEYLVHSPDKRVEYKSLMMEIAKMFT